MSLEDRFEALAGIGPAEPPTIADLQRRRQRRRRRQVVGSAGLVLVIVLAVGAALAVSHGSKQAGLSTVGQPTQPTQLTTTTTAGPIPVVTAATLIPGYVPAGLALAHSGPGASEAIIIQSFGTVPAQDRGRPGGPRGLYSLTYVGGVVGSGSTIRPTANTAPPLRMLGADASTEADYPTGFMAGFDSSTSWEHPMVDGRRLDLTQGSAASDEWSAYFTEQGVVVMVTAQHLSRADFLRFVGGLRVEVTG